MPRVRWLAVACVVLGACSQRPEGTLIEAVEKSDMQTLALLLTRGRDPNQFGLHYATPLTTAASRGSMGAIGLLLRYGADPDLSGGSNGWTPLMHAIHANQMLAVRALLDGGAQVDRTGRGGETALMMAAGYGYTPIVELLLDRGANPRAVAADGSNVLAIALTGVPDLDRFTLASCHWETVQVLKRRYPDLHLPNNLWARVAQMAGGVARLRGCSY